MVNKPSLQMELRYFGGNHQVQEQRLVIAPVANTEEAAVDRAQGLAATSNVHFQEGYIDLLQTRISEENLQAPYSDNQLASYLSSEGFSTSRTEVARARLHLGIEPSSKRLEDIQ
jgi:DNA-directed RNA polymerase specialized sigma54-like protein